jgi:hypothetical protein
VPVRWQGTVEPFVAWCVETVDLPAFGEALRSVPGAAWPAVKERLAAALAQPGPGEPEADQLRRDTPLVDRMRSPAGVLRRQIRLEKQRLLETIQES